MEKIELTPEELEQIYIVLSWIDIVTNIGELKKLELAFKLLEFTVIFRTEHGILAMVRYIQWGRDHNLNRKNMLGDIIHDIEGRHEDCMSPRTSNYLSYIKEE